MNSQKRIHVVAAVIEQDNKIFLAQRPKHLHQGGLWEFPGGKVEINESSQHALDRELHEEIGITPTSKHPLIKIAYDYPDKKVLLDVWRVNQFTGKAHGKEGQNVCWANKNELNQFEFPAANKPIVTAAQLAPYYVISPNPDTDDFDSYISQLETQLVQDDCIIQIRAKNLNAPQQSRLFKRIMELPQASSAKVMFNCDLALASTLKITNIHLSSQQLHQIKEPLDKDLFIGASCHNENDVLHAEKIGAHFIVLSCIKKTQSHPESQAMGWEKFAEFCQLAKIPVYALGGLGPKDYTMAIQCGAQGVAGISAFWNKSTH